MKLPSLQSLWSNLLSVVVRFPLQVLCAVVAAVSWCIVVDAGNIRELEEQLIRLICGCNLALALLLAGDLYAEVNILSAKKKWGLRLLALGISAVLYWILHPEFYIADVYRIGMLAFAFHLLVAFAPFVGRGNINGFWQYNKTLFLRFLTSALYAAVLFAGLAIALSAVNELFDVNITWRVYMRLFAVVTAGFMTVFFLAGVPTNFVELDEDRSYPKGLKIFTQYVLMPLMTIYLLILLVYEVKIILVWELPKGLVSILILGYAVFGILSLLLIHPVKDKEENGWIKLFSRFFYVMMIPLVVLLLLAVWKRVGSYGITESRYILTVLAIWLTVVTAYFLLSKRQNIMMIPVSLCILSLLAVYGPQSVFSVSRYSQTLRLKKVMSSNDKKDLRERSEIVSYLVRRHGLKSLQGFTKRDLDAIESRMEVSAGAKYSRYSLEYQKVDTAYKILNIKQVPDEAPENIVLLSKSERVVNIKGYDFMVQVNGNFQTTDATVNGMDLHVQEFENYKLKLKIDKETEQTIDVMSTAKRAFAAHQADQEKPKATGYNSYYLPESVMRSETVQFKKCELVLVFSEFNLSADPALLDSGRGWMSYTGTLLIRLK